MSTSTKMTGTFYTLHCDGAPIENYGALTDAVGHLAAQRDAKPESSGCVRASDKVRDGMGHGKRLAYFDPQELGAQVRVTL